MVNWEDSIDFQQMVNYWRMISVRKQNIKIFLISWLFNWNAFNLGALKLRMFWYSNRGVFIFELNNQLFS